MDAVTSREAPADGLSVPEGSPGNRVSVVLPTLNEAGNIDRVLGAVLDAGRRGGLDLEVIVVDDGSSDGTRDRVRSWEGSHRVRLLCRERDRGLSGAVLAGAASASSGVVVVMDADLSHPPEEIPRLANLVLGGSADMAIGSRYVPGGGTPDWPLRRRIISRGAAMLARPLTDARDPLSGFFAVKRSVLLEAGKDAAGFKIGLEVQVRGGRNLRITEVPISFRDRTEGESKLGGAVVGAYLSQLAALAGGVVSKGSAARFAIVGLLGVFVDLTIFQALLYSGAPLGLAHVVSFVAAATTNYLLDARWAFERKDARRDSPADARSKSLSLGGYAAFAFVAVLALFLRGGVLAFFIRTLGWHPGAAIVPAILAAAVVNYVGCAFFVFAPRGRTRSPATAWRLAAVGVTLYLLVLRGAYLGSTELIPQEAYYWNYSQHLDIGYLDHPPIVAWIIRAGTALLGQTELAVRIGALVSSLAVIAFTYLLTRNLLGRAAAYVAVLLVAALPFYFATGYLMTPDAPLVACWAGALYFLERAILGNRGSAWWGAGACVGLGMLSKYTIALVAVSALVYLILDRRSRRWLRSPVPYGAAALALLLFSPVIIWNARNGWASFAFQGPRRWSQESNFELHTLAAEVLLLITPMGLLGYIHGLLREKSARRFGLIFTLVPLAVFVVSSLHNETKLNWTGPLWLAAVPFMASSIVSAAEPLRDWPSRTLVHGWKLLILGLLVAYGFVLHFEALGVPGVPYPQGAISMGWRDLGHQVETIERDVESQTGAKPLVVGMDKYFISSAIAFYDPDGDGALSTAGKSLFGKRSLMYDMWFPPERQRGKSIVLVGTEVKNLESQSVKACVTSLEPVRELTVSKGGNVVGRFFARVVHGYDPQGRFSAPKLIETDEGNPK